MLDMFSSIIGNSKVFGMNKLVARLNYKPLRESRVSRLRFVPN